MKNERIVVCGGALAGMASALGLRKAGFDVSILSPAYKSMQLEAGQYHPRVYAVSVASQRFLAQLGAWNLMSSQRISPSSSSRSARGCKPRIPGFRSLSS